MAQSVRRAAALFLALLLALGTFPAFARTISCDQCGKSLNGEKYTYCPYCGTKITNAISIRSAYQTDKGNLHLEWDDDASNTPHSVCYRYSCSPYYNSDQQQSQIYWIDADGIYDETLEMTRLAPGYDYWLVVEDNAGNVCKYLYYAPGVYPFKEFSTEMTLYPRRKSGSDYIKLSSFSASTLEAGGNQMGLYIQCKFPTLNADRTYHLKGVAFDPNGVPTTVLYTSDAVLKEGWNNVYWNFLDLDWYFDIVKKQYGSILKGEYKLSLYFNGQYANSGSFTVK